MLEKRGSTEPAAPSSLGAHHPSNTVLRKFSSSSEEKSTKLSLRDFNHRRDAQRLIWLKRVNGVRRAKMRWLNL
jgi:hypothetical protein